MDGGVKLYCYWTPVLKGISVVGICRIRFWDFSRSLLEVSPLWIFSLIIRIIESPTTSSCVAGLELPFMMMPHPLIPVSLPPASVTMAMSQMNHLSTIANMAAAAQGQSLPSRMVTSVIKVNFNTERSDCWFSHTDGYFFFLRSGPSTLDIYFVCVCVCVFVAAGVAGTFARQSLPGAFLRGQQEARQSPIVPPQQQCVQLPSPYRKLLRQDTYVSISTARCCAVQAAVASNLELYLWRELMSHCFVHSSAAHHNGLSMNHALLGLSPNMPPGPKEGDLAHDMSHELKRMHADKGETGFIVRSGNKVWQ